MAVTANILVVDDRPENLLAVEATLEPLGQRLVFARSGQEALRAVLHDDFAVILLDVQMHGLDGFETARRIREREKNRRTPIIFVTAYEGDRLSSEKAYALGAVDYLVKPLVPVILRAKVAGFIELFEKSEEIKRQAEQLRQLERREFEQRLVEEGTRRRDIEQRFSWFMRRLPGLAWIKDDEGRYVYVNEAAEKAFRTPVSELYGKTDDEVFPPEVAARFKENDRRALIDGAGVQVVETLEQEDRTLRHSLVTKFPIPLQDGRTALVGGIAIDITDFKRAEEALRQSEEHFHTLADSIPQLAWMTRPDGYILWFNKRCYEYTGMSHEELQGWTWQSILDPVERPRVIKNWTASLASGEPWEDTFPLRRHDDEMRWHLSRALPLRDKLGRILGWFGTNTDITDRMRIEEELRAAKEEAEAANKAKDQFLAVLSHELRTPLNPILLAVTSMLEQPLPTDDEVRPNLEMIRQNVEIEARLIDDLLDVTNIRQGKLRLGRQTVDAHVLVREALEICRDEIATGGLDLTLDLSAPRSHVEGDSARLQQVLWNLIKNAAKFTPPGGSIAIRTRAGGTGEADLVVEVTDSGVGIAAEALPRIFNAFEQADASVAKQFGGLGLGLAISRSLAEAHGGLLTAASAGPGLGSTFTFVLPTVDAPAPVPAGSPAPALPEGPLPPLRILLVEDNPDSRRVLARLLGHKGHRVTPASSVASALDAAADCGPFDMVISDLGLPDGSGLDVMRHVLSRGPVCGIALSGYGREDDVRRAREAGFSSHLTKPVDFPCLEDEIRRVLWSGAGQGG